VKANIGRSSAKVLTEHAVLVVSCFKLAPRPGMFTVLDLHKTDVRLIGWELTGGPDSGQRLNATLFPPVWMLARSGVHDS